MCWHFDKKKSHQRKFRNFVELIHLMAKYFKIIFTRLTVMTIIYDIVFYLGSQKSHQQKLIKCVSSFPRLRLVVPQCQIKFIRSISTRTVWRLQENGHRCHGRCRRHTLRGNICAQRLSSNNCYIKAKVKYIIKGEYNKNQKVLGGSVRACVPT